MLWDFKRGEPDKQRERLSMTIGISTQLVLCFPRKQAPNHERGQCRDMFGESCEVLCILLQYHVVYVLSRVHQKNVCRPALDLLSIGYRCEDRVEL